MGRDQISLLLMTASSLSSQEVIRSQWLPTDANCTAQWRGCRNTPRWLFNVTTRASKLHGRHTLMITSCIGATRHRHSLNVHLLSMVPSSGQRHLPQWLTHSYSYQLSDWLTQEFYRKGLSSQRVCNVLCIEGVERNGILSIWMAFPMLFIGLDSLHNSLWWSTVYTGF